jgi:hypothetical protein
MVNISIARQHIEKLYFDRCDIIEFVTVKEDGLTYKKEIVTHSDIPCKISYERQNITGDDIAPSTSLISKLILNPDIEVKAGSKITVYRKGKPTHYECSAEPARFYNHQEIWITLLEGYA